MTLASPIMSPLANAGALPVRHRHLQVHRGEPHEAAGLHEHRQHPQGKAGVPLRH